MKTTFIPAAACAFLLTTGGAFAANVEVYALDLLDSTQNGYCIDISGGQGAQANPDNGLQGHTCYSPSGALFVDQSFEADRFADGVFYMPEFDVCMQAASTEAGAALELAACDGSAAQGFAFSGEGTITPAANSDMCLTLGTDTRSGRSDTNQIKTLTLAACADDLAAYQTWGNRTAD